jgi:hypothetical protein
MEGKVQSCRLTSRDQSRVRNFLVKKPAVAAAVGGFFEQAERKSIHH